MIHPKWDKALVDLAWACYLAKKEENILAVLRERLEPLLSKSENLRRLISSTIIPKNSAEVLKQFDEELSKWAR